MEARELIDICKNLSPEELAKEIKGVLGYLANGWSLEINLWTDGHISFGYSSPNGYVKKYRYVTLLTIEDNHLTEEELVTYIDTKLKTSVDNIVKSIKKLLQEIPEY